MKQVRGPGVLLGVGLGMLLTALVGLVFYYGTNPTSDDETVIRRATELGMQWPAGLDGVVHTGDGSILFDVAPGESVESLAERLERAGILDGTLEFMILARQEGFSGPLNGGTFSIPAMTDARGVLNALLEAKR